MIFLLLYIFSMNIFVVLPTHCCFRRCLRLGQVEGGGVVAGSSPTKPPTVAQLCPAPVDDNAAPAPPDAGGAAPQPRGPPSGSAENESQPQGAHQLLVQIFFGWRLLVGGWEGRGANHILTRVRIPSPGGILKVTDWIWGRRPPGGCRKIFGGAERGK